MSRTIRTSSAARALPLSFVYTSTLPSVSGLSWMIITVRGRWASRPVRFSASRINNPKYTPITKTSLRGLSGLALPVLGLDGHSCHVPNVFESASGCSRSRRLEQFTDGAALTVISMYTGVFSALIYRILFIGDAPPKPHAASPTGQRPSCDEISATPPL